VNWDQALGVKLAVQHLAELGHREILWLGPESPSERSSFAIREHLFVTTAWDAGLRGASCRYTNPPDFGPFPAEKWSDAAAEALGQYISEREKNSFSAILCYNDVTALGAYRALRSAGLSVPKDISVVAFDNIEAPLLIPKLTTVDHMLHEMGRSATEMLLEITKDVTQWPQYSGRRVTIAPELILRESTRAFARP
jgi:DNA-binding LacI/PurR family transcriptional regulator